ATFLSRLFAGQSVAPSRFFVNFAFAEFVFREVLTRSRARRSVMGHLQRFGPRPPRRLVTLIMRTRDMRLVWMIAPYARAFHGWFIATRAARAQVPPARRRWLRGVLWWPLRPRARLRHNRRPDRCCARSRSEPARRAGSPKRPGRPRP